MLTAILNIIAALMGFFKPKADSGAEVAKTATTQARASADVARENTTTTEKDIQHVEDQTTAAVSGINASDSLRDIALASQRAIDAANHQPGADD